MVDESSQKIIIRPPVVVVLGHVDHGKTSLLDIIRKTKVADKETGGITQHIGAYEILHQGKKITFIDTPGHEAFSATRSRGAKVADVAVLVVAADEGVKVQTKEAISHIKKENIPIIVALNKIDKPEANAQKVIRELSQEDILAEQIGGKVPCLQVSAKTGQGVPELLELILLVADMENLKADVSKPAEGVIIEANLNSFKGPIVTLILRNGALKAGDIIGTDSGFGKIKKLENYNGEKVEEALPGLPAVVLGFEEVPSVGEEIKIFPDLDSAKLNVKKREKTIPDIHPSEEQERKILNLIIKADFVGSIDAVEHMLKAIPHEKISIRIIRSEVGDVSEADVKTAKGANAKIVGFRVKTSQSVKNLAERDGIRIVIFDIIYELVQSIRGLMEKMLEPEITKQNLGRLRVIAVFKTERTRQTIGGKVVEGEIKKGAQAEIIRNEEKIGTGRLVNLQRNKKDIDKVIRGDECGLLFDSTLSLQEGDYLGFYTEERKRGELE